MILSPSLALLAAVAAILILLRIKVHTGFAVFAGAVILALLVLPLRGIPGMLLDTIRDYQTIRLLVIIASALTVSKLMEERGMLAELAGAMERLTPKLAVHLVPAVIGFVPMPGGALVSATAVRDLVGKLGLEPAKSTFINYWFRHIWEYSIPVYPALIAAGVLLDVPLSRLLIVLFPGTLLAIACGSVASFRLVKDLPGSRGTASKGMAVSFIKAAWPIVLLVIMILAGLDAIIAYPVIMLLLIVQQRPRLRQLGRSFRYGLEPRILFFLYSVMLFKGVIETSGAAEAILADLQSFGLPVSVTLTLLPFIIGLVTAFSVAFVGIAFPLLMPLIVPASGLDSFALLLAYGSGMIGMMISPLHLCLVLSAEYFNARLIEVYRYLIVPALTVLVVLVAVFSLAYYLV